MDTPNPRTIFNGFFGVQHPFDPTKEYVTSPFQLLTPGILIVMRLTFLTSSFGLFIAVQNEGHFSDGTNNFLVYLTLLPFIFMDTYLCGACMCGWDLFCTARGLLPMDELDVVESISTRERNAAAYTSARYVLQSSSCLLQNWYVFLATAVRTYPLYVAITFWTILTTSSSFSSPMNEFSHKRLQSFSVALSIFEILATNLPVMPWFHLISGICFLAGYIGLVNKYEPVKPDVAYYPIGIHCLLYVAVFLLVQILISIRIRAFRFVNNVYQRRKLGGTGRRSYQRSRGETSTSREIRERGVELV